MPKRPERKRWNAGDACVFHGYPAIIHANCGDGWLWIRGSMGVIIVHGCQVRKPDGTYK